MSDLIDREEALAAICRCGDIFVTGYPIMIEKAEAQSAIIWVPTAEKRKRGEWTKECSCPFCGFLPWYERDIHTLSYCPNCGADMREEKQDEERKA